MNYRELQKACKDKGLNAKGSKAELIARLEEASEVTIEVPVTVGKSRFVYTGDPNHPGEDPAWCNAHGYIFKLNGAAVSVSDEAAARLVNNSHFTEK